MTPPPVDLNKLKSILGASKAIMNKVESGNFETGHIDPRALNEDGIEELRASGVVRPQSNTPSVNYNAETVQNSRLPDAVKKIMLEKPIPQLTNPNYTFSLDDVKELANDKPVPYPKTPKTNPRVISESSNGSDYITISKTELNEMVSNIVNEKLLEFFSKSYNKAMTEETVKKTISVLVKEGRLTPKKKSI